MIILISSILTIIFAYLSFIHIYWLFGGKWGLVNVIPTKNNNENSLEIPKVATLVVAIVLFCFSLLYLIKSEVLLIQLPIMLTKYSYWVIPIIFLLRVIGDFNYVGLFKKINDTNFAKADSKLFIPLCSIIFVLGILIQLIST